MNRKLLLENERAAWIFLNRIPDLTPGRFHRLLHALKSAEAILDASPGALQAAEVGLGIAENWHCEIRAPANRDWIESELNRLNNGEAGAVTELDPDYPAALRELIGRPPVLYYRGQWPIPSLSRVALVGTRRASDYGKSVAEQLATDLSLEGVTTVSGLAAGIDTVVHKATLHARGYTIGVLGCGLAKVFPAENAALYDRLAHEGTLVSEFPLDQEPRPYTFPRRNRIISGLSQGVVVIEAGIPSGALITARFAAEQGRDVFAVPGSVQRPGSAGCHRLIKEGAKLVEQATDILEELNLPKPATARSEPRVMPDLTELERMIFERIEEESISADELVLKTKRRFEEVAKTLLSLELKGIIRAMPGQRYART
jgi:DNA processing protein